MGGRLFDFWAFLVHNTVAVVERHGAQPLPMARRV